MTKGFWLSVPWWVYLLTVGSVLIAFAIRNEALEKRNGKSFKSSIKNISEKLDL